ncbi:uncharacterized protein LOC116262655 [Nymphaea colorata]|nr:uncharacterized protein LOC116262655 [Nymphaea colorata]
MQKGFSVLYPSGDGTKLILLFGNYCMTFEREGHRSLVLIQQHAYNAKKGRKCELQYLLVGFEMAGTPNCQTSLSHNHKSCSNGEAELVKAVCVCCSMCEECTKGYVGTVQDRFCGVWVCGLCAEAIKEEQAKLGVSVEAALKVHISLCARFNEMAKIDPRIHIAGSILQILKKIVGCQTTPSSPTFTITKPRSEAKETL